MSKIKCDERRQTLMTKLEQILETHNDSNVYVKQSFLLSLLGLSDEDKSILTHAVKVQFPNSTKKSLTLDHATVYPFIHSG